MSNKVSKIAKEMKETEILRQNITNTVYGSLVQSTLILREIEWTDEEFVKRFKKAELPFIEDEDFIKKTIEAVGLKYEDVEGLPLVFVESEKNTLFMPIIQFAMVIRAIKLITPVRYFIRDSLSENNSNSPSTDFFRKYAQRVKLPICSAPVASMNSIYFWLSGLRGILSSNCKHTLYSPGSQSSNSYLQKPTETRQSPLAAISLSHFSSLSNSQAQNNL